MTRCFSISGFSILFLFISKLLTAQSFVAEVSTRALHKCYGVVDSVSGYFNKDSVFVAHGPFKEFNKQKLRVEGQYTHGLRNGVWKKYYDDGKLCTKGMYADDKEHGAWRYYYDTDTLASTFFYNRGQKVGNWTGYAFNGRKQLTQSYDSLGRLILEHFWYTTGKCGKAFADSIIYVDSDTTVHRSLYYKNGKTFVNYTYVNRKNFGEYTKYYLTGALWERLNYKHGEISAVLDMYDIKGNKLDFGTFDYGVGNLKRYHMNGKVWVENNYKGDITNYEQAYYGHSGVMESRGLISNGNPAGLWTTYTGGKKNLEVTFKDSGVVTIGYYLNSLISYERSYKFGYAHGKWTNYNNYGEIELTRHFDMGYLHGPFEGYYSGPIASKGNYYHGNPIGEWVFTGSAGGKFLYKMNFDTKPFLDTTDMVTNFRLPDLSSWCKSEFDFSVKSNDEMFYDGDGYCTNWTQSLYALLFGYTVGSDIPDGLVQIDFKVGLMGEIYDQVIRRSYTDDVNTQLMVTDIVNRFPFLRPNIRMGIPQEGRSSYGYFHEFERPKD